MTISSSPAKLHGQKKSLTIIKCTGKLTGAEAAHLRLTIADCAQMHYDTVCIDAKEIIETDLSGINEIIQSHYTLAKSSKNLVFLYKMSSSIEKWVHTTGLDKFIDTAIVPQH